MFRLIFRISSISRSLSIRSMAYEIEHNPFEDNITRKLSEEAIDSLNESTDNLCKICFGMEPDAIFMDCGHGGVCYECSLDVWKTTEECYLCRKEIKQVLQVEVNKKGKKGFYKVIACTQVEDDDENNGQMYEEDFNSNGEDQGSLPDDPRTG